MRHLSTSCSFWKTSIVIWHSQAQPFCNNFNDKSAPAVKPSLKGATIISGPRKKPWDWKAKGSHVLEHVNRHLALSSSALLQQFLRQKCPCSQAKPKVCYYLLWTEEETLRLESKRQGLRCVFLYLKFLSTGFGSRTKKLPKKIVLFCSILYQKTIFDSFLCR